MNTTYKGYIHYWIVVLIVLTSCSGEFQTYDLNQEYATSIHYAEMSADDKPTQEEGQSDLVGIPALTFYNGDLKRGAIWWGGKGITLEKGDIFTISAINTGPDSIPFGATFPPIDLVSEKVMIKVTARAQNDSGAAVVAPVLYLQAGDVDGYQTNEKVPFQKIEISEEFQYYYFDMRDIYTQTAPKRKVNGKMINSLKFFINPGQTAFTGKIFITEIKVVAASSVEK